MTQHAGTEQGARDDTDPADSHASGGAAAATELSFEATLMLQGKTATGIEVPPLMVQSLGVSRRPAVRVTMNGHTYRSTIAMMRGVYMLPVSAENRTAARLEAGDRVQVGLVLDSAPREVEVPADLAQALDAEPLLRARFDQLPFTLRKEHVRALLDAKKPETRQRRLTKTLSALRG